jgi:hypothetical protein
MLTYGHGNSRTWLDCFSLASGIAAVWLKDRTKKQMISPNMALVSTENALIGNDSFYSRYFVINAPPLLWREVSRSFFKRFFGQKEGESYDL